MRIIALALAGGLLFSTAARAEQTPNVELTDLCGKAMDASTLGKSPDEMQERFVGRLEMEMTGAKLSEDTKAATRVVCGAYHTGYVKALTYAVGLLKEIQDKKVVQR